MLLQKQPIAKELRDGARNFFIFIFIPDDSGITCNKYEHLIDASLIKSGT